MQRRNLWWCHVCLLATLAYAVINSPLVHRHRVYEARIDLVLGVALPAAANAITVLRAVRQRTQRAAWAALSIGMLLYNAGNAVYLTKIQFIDPIPFPSVADALSLAGYVGLWVGLLLLLAGRARNLPGSVWLDGAIGAAGTVAIALSVAYQGLVPSAPGALSTVITNAAYPVFDLLLMVTVCLAFAVSGWRPGRSWWAIGAALVSFAVADTLFLGQISAGSYLIGGELDVLWALPYVFLAYASTEWRTSARVSLDGWAMIVAPLLMTTTGLSLILLQQPLHLRWPAVLAAGSTVALALVRMAWTFRQVGRLLGDRRLARTDDLTGLANRRALRERLEAALTKSNAEEQIALLLLDLDRFKEVNDTFGHEAGDTLLQEVAARLATSVREQDVLARLGGDEFAVVLRGDEQLAVTTAERLLACLEAPLVVRGSSVSIGGSVGVVAGPVAGQSASELLRAADVAMYVAKGRGGGVATYDRAGDQHGAGRLELAGEVRNALATEQFTVHYQPQIDLSTGHVVGVEALVRWQHPTRGLLPPASFLPLIDRAGLERVLLRRVLLVALTQAAAWRANGTTLRMSVNITARDLLDELLPGHLTAELQRLSLPGHMLVLEVTENDLVVASTRMASVLSELRALGVSLSIDDFGTGYSSMRRLKEIGPSEIKIDRSFVARLDVAADDYTIVQATIELGHNLGMRTVAEGVESPTVRRLLTDLGCDEAQGYQISPPLPASDLEQWLAGQTVSAYRTVPQPARSRAPDPESRRSTEPGRDGSALAMPSAGSSARPDRASAPTADLPLRAAALIGQVGRHVGLVLSAGLLLAYLVWQLAWARHGQRSTLIVGDAAVSVAGLWATGQAVCTARSGKVAASTRRSWWLLAAAFAFNTLGTFLQGVIEGVMHQPGHPSPADVAYLVVAPLATVGLLLLPCRRAAREMPALLWVDVAITTVAGAGLLWYFELGHATSASVPIPLKLTLIAYPTNDLALLVAMSVLLHRTTDPRTRGPLRILLAAVGVFIVSDLAFGELAARGIYHGGDLIDTGYVVAMLLGAVAASRQRAAARPFVREAVIDSPAGRSLSKLPYLALLTASTVLLTASRASLRSPVGGLLLAVGVLTVLVTFRQWSTLRANAQLLDAHDDQALTDGVTGVATRSHFLQVAGVEFARARSSQRPLCALLVDIDRFKAFNSRYGHQAGDDILADLANRCREHTGPLALLGRYGGDTVVVLLPEHTQEEAYALACRLQDASGRGMSDYAVSIGVASTVGTANLAELLQHCDDALLNAKDSGRACTRTYA